MARRRVRIQWIKDEDKRKAVYKGRLAGMVKKVNDLTVLCDVKACLVVYPNEPEAAEPAVVWPSPAEATELIKRFREIPESSKNKKREDSVTLVRQKIEKPKVMVDELKRGNAEREVDLMVKDLIAKPRKSSIDGLTLHDLAAVGTRVQILLREVNETLARRRELQPLDMAPPPPLATAAVNPTPPMSELGGSSDEVIPNDGGP